MARFVVDVCWHFSSNFGDSLKSALHCLIIFSFGGRFCRLSPKVLVFESVEVSAGVKLVVSLSLEKGSLGCETLGRAIHIKLQYKMKLSKM